jgi:hypothetical protein
MRCAYHPDREAAAQCAQCEKPLCEECSRCGRNRDIILCGNCLLLEAATHAAQTIGERQEEREVRRQDRELRGKKKSNTRVYVILAFALVVLLVNLYFYLSPGIPVEQFDPYQDPFLTAVLIESALLDYAESHEGEFPRRLKDLLDGEYLPSGQITEAVLKGYEYTRSTPRSYELRIKDTQGGRLSDTVFTQEEVNR